jgi:hypothetical protein
MDREKRYMVIRTSDDEPKWIWEKLQKGEVRQGWGVTGTQLKENGELVSPEVWKERYRQNGSLWWGKEISEAEAEKRYWILRPMAELEEGDLLVIPKMPLWNTFTIVTVDKGYSFDYDALDQREGDDDYRHIISIDHNNIKQFSYLLCEDTRIISKKLRGYQCSVNTAWNDDFKVSVTRLLDKPSDTTSNTVIKIFSDIQSDTHKHILYRLRKLPPRDLENLVAILFENNGYDIFAKNRSNGQGGDADLILTMKLPLISDSTELALRIYIQIKQKDGEDWNDVEGINQLVSICESEGDGVKILISTADKFSNKCDLLAQEHKVTLLSGYPLVELLARYL